MEKILLIDGHSILNRAFYGLPDLTNSQGLHTNAVLGFFNILMKILEEEKPDYLTVAFDVSAPTFRHAIYQEYKGTRKQMPEELMQQVPVMKDTLKAMGISIMEKEGYEADDILGTIAILAEKKGMDVSILSGDRDLLQLASDKIKIRIPKTKRGITEVEDYYAADVKKTYGVTPIEFIDMKALMGDASDNIPGVPGIGEKTASKIIQAFGSIEAAREHIEEITPAKAREGLRLHYDLAELSKILATIKTDCELDYQLENGKKQSFFNKEAYDIFSKLEFKNLIKKYFTEEFKPQKQQSKTIQRAVTDLQEFEELYQQAQTSQRMASFCIADSELLGLSLTFDENISYWIPVEGFLTAEYLLEKWNNLLKSSPCAIFLNLKENMRFIHTDLLKQYSGRWYDIGIAAYLLNPIKEAYHYTDIAADYLDISVETRADLIGKLSLSKAITEKPEEFLQYVCCQSQIPFLAFSILQKKLQEANMEQLYIEMEMPLIFTLYHMEQAGIRVEREALFQYGQRLSKRIKEVENSIYSQVQEQFNINSPKQLGEILFEKLKLPGGKKTKTGYSTAVDVLDKLAPDYPVVTDILEYRQLTKLKSTYADGLATYIGPDQRIHGTFNQTITATGRISSTDPNLQNIPIKMEIGREIRKVFVPEENYIFMDADYSQIELRVLAHLSGDERLIAAYQEAEDIHTLTASQVFHIPFDEVTSVQRRNAKAVNFGIIYGISSFGLSQDLSISKKEAQDYIEHYFKAYPQIKEYLDGLVKEAREKGYTVTMFGRRRPIPELQSSNFMTRSFGERIAMNSPIQGTAADIIKWAMIRVDQRLHEQQLRSRLILQVHDELLIETHKEEIEQVKQILEEEMSQAAKLKVELDIDLHTGNNWFETK